MQVASCLTNVLDDQNLRGLSFLAEILSPSLSCINDVANNYARGIYSIMDSLIGGRQM
jgi:hypothetical protein